MSTNVTYEDAILETLTLPEELKIWCKDKPKFLEALKFIASSRFLHLGAVIHYPKNKLLGIYSYDYQIKNPKFKQDFIEYSNISNPTFTLYTSYIRKTGGPSEWVKDINVISKKLESFNKGISSHHLLLEELPNVVKERGQWAIEKGNELKRTGVRKLTQAELEQWFNEVQEIKTQGKWYIWMPVKSPISTPMLY